MNAQRFLHTIDAVSTWTGKAAAWLVVGLMGLVCAEVFKRYPLRLIGGTFSVLACFALFYLTTTFALSYGATTLHYDRSAFLGVQIGAILFMALGIALAGIWSDRSTPCAPTHSSSPTAGASWARAAR